MDHNGYTGDVSDEKKQVRELTDRYIKRLLLYKNGSNGSRRFSRFSEIPAEAIRIKRKELIMKRQRRGLKSGTE